MSRKLKPKSKETKRRTGRWIFILVGLVAVAVALIASRLFQPLNEPTPSSSPQASTLNQFVGSEACAKCHQDEYNAWRGSTHGRAGGSPKDATLIARFDGQP